MKKNIIILVPALWIGGQERQAILLAEQLSQMTNCTIVVFFEAEPRYDTDQKVLNLNLPPCESKPGKVIQQLRRSIQLARLRKKNNIDLVISLGDTANLTNILSGGAGESIVSLRISWSAQYSFMRKCIYKRSDRILCQTEAMKSTLLNNYKNIEQKTSVFYNIFDIEGIQKKACEACSLAEESCLKIITVGRLDKQKGFRHLIRSFASIIPTIENAKLIIVGGGDEYGALKALAEHFGIQEKIVFTDAVSNPYKYMKNADIFVLSSCAEGFPNVLVEAMACGLPVIATDCETGPREILSAAYQDTKISEEIQYSDYGILVPAFQGDEISEEEKDKLLATAMLELLMDPAKRTYYSEMAKERANTFSISNAKHKIHDMFGSYL